MTGKQKRMVRDMRAHDLSYRAIADRLALAYNTVKSFCYRENLVATDFHGNRSDGSEYCKSCGTVLKRNPGAKQKIFCNDKCRYTWWNRQRTWKKKAYRLTCRQCGNEFDSYGNKKRKYCGRECYIRSRYGEGLP